MKWSEIPFERHILSAKMGEKITSEQTKKLRFIKPETLCSHDKKMPFLLPNFKRIRFTNKNYEQLTNTQQPRISPASTGR